MAKTNLKSILGKKSDVPALLRSIMERMDCHAAVTDENGNILFGKSPDVQSHEFPIEEDGEIAGWVKGNEQCKFIADLLISLSQKEAEKKKLGKEVLNLYQELNLIFNFSEKLAQTIDPSAIAQVALDEASHLIQSDSGVVVLWDEKSKQMEAVAASGESFFSQEKINSGISLLLKIALSGQSEITHDISALKEEGIISDKVNSIIYGALKVNHRVMGAIILANHEVVQYSAADLKLLTTLALQSSSAIESAMLYEKNIRESREREEAMRRIYEATNRFVPVEFIKSLGHHRITDVKLGDQVEKIVTVLFSDIRDFTTLSEQMTPQENFSFVQSFSEMMGPIIGKHKGFINQYLGDAIMAIFPNNAADGLSAAVEIQRALQQFNLERKSANLAPVQIGLGLHTGPLIMGIIGDMERLDAATISDTVNTASRLESLTKYYKAGILISDAALQQIIDPGNFHLRYLGKVQLKGKHAAIGIHECFSGNESHDFQRKLETLPVFRTGMEQYINKSFEKAGNAFLQVLEFNPGDLTAKFFLNNTNRYLHNGVPENWTGVEEMLNK
ncbi:MAG: adenylate/guanylate cyclase domain-containing protein [Bacteroidota bacterium]